MIVLDVNVLVTAWNQSDPQHADVNRWLQSLFEEGQPIGIPWLTRYAFTRITTNPRVFNNPLTLEEALEAVSDWARHPSVFEAEPGPNHLKILAEVAASTQSFGSRFTDAVLVAIAMEKGAALASLDRDFRRFPGLDWIDPVSDQPSR